MSHYFAVKEQIEARPSDAYDRDQW